MRSVTKSIILIIFGLAVLVPFASTFPDGLKRVVESIGLEEPESVWTGLMPDYTFPFATNPYTTKLVSGVIGLFIVFSMAWCVGWAIARKNRV